MHKKVCRAAIVKDEGELVSTYFSFFCITALA